MACMVGEARDATGIEVKAPIIIQMRAGDPARSSLGNPEPLLQMACGPAATVRGQKFPSASSLSIDLSNSASARGIT